MNKDKLHSIYNRNYDVILGKIKDDTSPDELFLAWDDEDFSHDEGQDDSLLQEMIQHYSSQY